MHLYFVSESIILTMNTLQCINQLQPVIFYFSTLIYYISKPGGLIASYYYLFSKIIALFLVSYSFLSEIVKWIQIERDTKQTEIIPQASISYCIIRIPQSYAKVKIKITMQVQQEKISFIERNSYLSFILMIMVILLRTQHQIFNGYLYMYNLNCNIYIA